jgi:hypothetical protein
LIGDRTTGSQPVQTAAKPIFNLAGVFRDPGPLLARLLRLPGRPSDPSAAYQSTGPPAHAPSRRVQHDRAGPFRELDERGREDGGSGPLGRGFSYAFRLSEQIDTNMTMASAGGSQARGQRVSGASSSLQARSVAIQDRGTLCPIMGWTDRAPRRTLRSWGASNRRSMNHGLQSDRAGGDDRH